MKLNYHYAEYDISGKLEKVANSLSEFVTEDLKLSGIYSAIDSNKVYKNKIFVKKIAGEDFDDKIRPRILATIDGIHFSRESHMARYLGVSRQAVQQAKERNAKQIMKKDILWHA